MTTVIAMAIALSTGAVSKCRTEHGRISRFADVGDKWKGGKSPCIGRRVEHTDWLVAHRALPCGTLVLITNRRTGRAVVAPVGTKGPWGACLDVGWTRGPCTSWSIKRRASDPGVWRGHLDATPPVFEALGARSFDRVTLEAL